MGEKRRRQRKRKGQGRKEREIAPTVIFKSERFQREQKGKNLESVEKCTAFWPTMCVFCN